MEERTMNESTKTKKALRGSLLALFLCIVLLIGTTFAWFTDTASTGVNNIQAGNLKVDLQMKDANGSWVSAEGKTIDFVKASGHENEAILWEPGCTYELPVLRVVNKGNLALKYKIKINGIQGDEKLNEVINWTISDVALDTDHSLAAGATSEDLTIKGHMQESAGNEYQGLSIDGISITIYATQDTVESDSFGNTYDANAGYPVTKYSNMKKAFADGGSIAINDNITADESKTAAADRVTVKAPTTLYLGAMYTVPGSLEDSNNWAALYVNKDLTINASSKGGINCLDKTEASASYIGGPYVAHIKGEDITVTVNGGKYYGGGTIFNVEKGTLIVNDGFFQVAPDVDTKDYRYTLNCIDGNYKNGTAKIIVKGGTYVNFDPSNNGAEGSGTNFVADGYKVVSEPHGSDTWYKVVAE
jgi:predicted ribosomally synthesized peptide with SipW-like signal peptide